MGKNATMLYKNNIIITVLFALLQYKYSNYSFFCFIQKYIKTKKKKNAKGIQRFEEISSTTNLKLDRKYDKLGA